MTDLTNAIAIIEIAIATATNPAAIELLEAELAELAGDLADLCDRR